MRRAEFQIDNQEQMDTFLKEQRFGVLGTIGQDGFPRLTPILFVYIPEQEAFYFHSSRKGEKVRQLEACSHAAFSVSEIHAMIPSSFLDPVYACPATTYFRSVHARGQMEIVSDPNEKTMFFTAFMEKLQPEGGYAPFDWTMTGYAKQEAAMIVYKLKIHELTAKFKFGQNLNDKQRNLVTQGLLERQAPGDHETIQWMEELDPKRCPFHQQDQD